MSHHTPLERRLHPDPSSPTPSHLQLSLSRKLPGGGRRPGRRHPTPVLSVALVLLLLTGLGVGSVPSLADPPPITAGTDAMTSPPPAPGSFTQVTLNLPQDFFGVGSDAFSPTIQLEGQDLTTSLGNSLPADTLVERQADANIQCGETSAPIPIELVALDLASTQPVQVPFNGGMDSQLWDVRVCLSNTNASTGTMTIEHTCLEGGTFTANLDVWSRAIFTRLTDGTVVILDPVPLKPFTSNGFWVHDPMTINALEIPPGTQVDGDCNGTFETTLQGTSDDFFVGIQLSNCTTCMPVTDQTKTLVPTAHEAPEGTHDVFLALGQVLTIPTLGPWGLGLLITLLTAAGIGFLIWRR